MSDLATRSETSFAKTCKTLGISEDGKRWLDIALDPCKDLNMPKAGFPDQIQMPSVIETVHTSFAVAAPGAAVWDCNIFFDSFYSTQTLYSTPVQALTYNFAQNGQVASTPRGGVVVRSGTSGATLDETATTVSYPLVQDVLTNAAIRVIGIGLEVHNTSSALNIGGAVTVWRAPNVFSDHPEIINISYDVTGTTACIPTSMPAVLIPEPPYTVTEAVDLPGSQQWEAKDGAYIVPVLNDTINQPSEPQPVCPLAQNSNSGNYFLPLAASNGTAKLVVIPSLNVKTPFSLSGAFFSGLPVASTLQVNLTYYVEIFPTKNNSLRRLSSPSPGLDSKALLLYSDVIKTLPIGCAVADNFIGAAIAGIARVAGMVARSVIQYAPTVGRALATTYQLAEGAYNIAEKVNQNTPSNQLAVVLSPRVPFNNHFQSQTETTNKLSTALSLMSPEQRQEYKVETASNRSNPTGVNPGLRRTKKARKNRRVQMSSAAIRGSIFTPQSRSETQKLT